MKAQIYNLTHILGAFLLFLAYGVLIARTWLGQTEAAGLRKFGGLVSGLGLLLLLVGGFGQLAVLHQNTFYPWVILKLVLWLTLGGLLAFINRRRDLSPALFWTTFALGALAAWAAYFKPGM